MATGVCTTCGGTSTRFQINETDYKCPGCGNWLAQPLEKIGTTIIGRPAIKSDASEVSTAPRKTMSGRTETPDLARAREAEAARRGAAQAKARNDFTTWEAIQRSMRGFAISDSKPTFADE